MSHAQPQFIDPLPHVLPALQLLYRSTLTEIYHYENDQRQGGEFGRLAKQTTLLHNRQQPEHQKNNLTEPTPT